MQPVLISVENGVLSFPLIILHLVDRSIEEFGEFGPLAIMSWFVFLQFYIIQLSSCFVDHKGY